ncbi:MAG: hypothetical protein JSW28_08785 [Thermoplasmata archaeon]|nr:MAG: hypothetical protein JSW28_08785 [Thermoplasmata archaeon]
MVPQEGKRYKDYKFYCCITLNRLVSAMGIDLYQPGLGEKVDNILGTIDYRVTKADIMHEIRSNHKMTNKVLKDLEEDGFIRIVKEERGYSIKITKEGIMHIRKFNEFYAKLFGPQLREAYKYRELPSALRAVR